MSLLRNPAVLGLTLGAATGAVGALLNPTVIDLFRQFGTGGSLHFTVFPGAVFGLIIGLVGAGRYGLDPLWGLLSPALGALAYFAAYKVGIEVGNVVEFDPYGAVVGAASGAVGAALTVLPMLLMGGARSGRGLQPWSIGVGAFAGAVGVPLLSDIGGDVAPFIGLQVFWQALVMMSIFTHLTRSSAD